MVSPKAIAIFALLAFGRVHAEADDDDCDDETTALSTTFATSMLSFTKTASSTATTVVPGDQDDDNDDCEDDDYITASLTTFTTMTNTASSTSVTSPAHGGHAPLTCIKAVPKSDGLVCGDQGYISRDEETGRFPLVQKDTLGESLDLPVPRSATENGGRCQLFIREFSTYGFTQTTSGTHWYEKGCYECSDCNLLFFKHLVHVYDHQTDQASTLVKTVLDIDFRAGEISDWSLTTVEDDTFFMDTRNVDGLLAMWILKATTDGRADINYNPTFELEGESTYEIDFAARSGLPVDPKNGLPETNFKLMTVYLLAHDKIIYEDIPTGGIWNGGQGWFKFSDKFVVPKANAGSTSLMSRSKQVGSSSTGSWGMCMSERYNACYDN
ncbi:hypothetical protein QQZ08_002938 [Neonectria magnoliae]|uniref:C2H2-type domain-containing protein n=1 Tax=Neonectria magnoliae TaxID=2732573 RepID=A0ABR1I9Z3_9HYPO